MSVLIGTSEPAIEQCLQIIISQTLQSDYEVTFTVLAGEAEIREASTTHNYGLVVLYLNTMFYGSCKGVRFDRALELIRHVKRREETTVLTITTVRPPGFASAAEQAGTDAILDAPFSVNELRKAICAPMEARA